MVGAGWTPRLAVYIFLALIFTHTAQPGADPQLAVLPALVVSPDTLRCLPHVHP